MKQIYFTKRTLMILVMGVLLTSGTIFAQVGIGTTSPDASAALEISATDKGLLLPRMTDTQRDAIASPVVGLMVFITDASEGDQIQFYDGSKWVSTKGTSNPVSSTTAVAGETFIFRGVEYGVVAGEANSGAKLWLDRNLGASRVATGSSDTDAYGYRFQWGRATDGHESSATTTAVKSDNPSNSDFILNGSATSDDFLAGDWRDNGDDTLWQGLSGTNNPCPSGFRLPTESEWDTEAAQIDTNHNSGNNLTDLATSSNLRLPAAGRKSAFDGSLVDAGNRMAIWLSDTSGSTRSRSTYTTTATMSNETDVSRAVGLPVRCIKD